MHLPLLDPSLLQQRTLTFDAEAWHQKKAAGEAASVDETKRDDEIDVD